MDLTIPYVIYNINSAKPTDYKSFVESVNNAITIFAKKNGSKKSRVLALLIQRDLFKATQHKTLASELSGPAKTQYFPIRGYYPEDFLRRAKKRQSEGRFSGAANDYCAFFLLDQQDFKSQNEAVEALSLMGLNMMGKDLCPALVINVLFNMIRNARDDWGRINKLVRVLNLERFFSEEPFSIPQTPTFFSAVSDTLSSTFLGPNQPDYAVLTAAAYVVISGLDAQDLEAMQQRLKDHKENALDRVVLRVAREFLEAMKVNRASCLKFLITDSFRAQIESLHALSKPEARIGNVPSPI